MKSTVVFLGFLACGITAAAQQVFKNDELTVSKLKAKTWVVETSDMTTMYILEGDERAMLIDTGTKCTALDEIVRKITSKPLDVVITHLHPDHAGNIRYFDSIYLHPADTVMMNEYHYDGKINYVADGQVFDLGGTKIEVALMPGHTPGSIVLLNRATGDCFSGDAFGSGQVWLQLEPHVPMTEYLQSCRRMRKLMEQDGIRYIWCGHYPYVKNYYDLGYICKMEALAQRLASGDTEGSKPYRMAPSTHAFGHSACLSDGPVMIVYNADKINSARVQIPGWGPQSKVLTDSLYSDVLKANRNFNVFLPKSYDVDTTKNYPILYLLHGMLDTNQGWTRRGHVKDVMDQLVASGEACEMIIVTPDAGGNIYAGQWNGYFNMPGWAYEDFFYKEFVPYIEKTYRVMDDKRHRAVAGLSMGGGGATSYAQRHSDMFCAAYAMSALMSIPAVSENSSPNPDDKMALLTKSVIEHSCLKFVEEADDARVAQLRSVQWFVDCGDDDFLLDRNIEFVQAMRKAQIPCQFRVRDGGHTWEYWHSALYTCLRFVTRCFDK